jgi:purine-binding chemotaxis protein CheW
MSEQSFAQHNVLAQTQEAFGNVDGEPTDSADAIQFITFAIGDDHYGVAIMAVREIKNWTGVRPLPHQPDYVRGICGLRGAFIPIIDLRCRFGQGLTEPTPHHVSIIVQIGQQHIGLLVDRVSDIVSVEPATIKPVPDVGKMSGAGFLSGLVNIDDAAVGLIDLDSILGAATEAARQPELLSA